LLGVSDYLAQDEEHALYIARQIVAQLNYAKKTPLPKQYFEAVAPPLYDPGTTSPLHHLHSMTQYITFV